jgi:hypothetical protein
LILITRPSISNLNANNRVLAMLRPRKDCPWIPPCVSLELLYFYAQHRHPCIPLWLSSHYVCISVGNEYVCCRLALSVGWCSLKRPGGECNSRQRRESLKSSHPHHTWDFFPWPWYRFPSSMADVLLFQIKFYHISFSCCKGSYCVHP